jgi:hypothetical protein
MEKLSEKLEQLTIKLESEKAKFDQITNFDHTLNNLQKIITLEKPTYSYPLIDTIGRRLNSTINKKR